jgi:hypothetical protein
MGAWREAGVASRKGARRSSRLCSLSPRPQPFTSLSLERSVARAVYCALFGSLLRSVAFPFPCSLLVLGLNLSARRPSRAAARREPVKPWHAKVKAIFRSMAFSGRVLWYEAGLSKALSSAYPRAGGPLRLVLSLGAITTQAAGGRSAGRFGLSVATQQMSRRRLSATGNAGYRALEGGTRINTEGRFLLVEPTANEFDGLDVEQFLPVWLVSENALEHRLRLARRAVELDDLLDFG